MAQSSGSPVYSNNKFLMSQLGFSSIHVNNCDSCSIVKSHKLPFTLSEKSTTAPFQLIHSDLWGPTTVPSFVGFRYYICFVDDFTKYTWLYPLKHKSQDTPPLSLLKKWSKHNSILMLKFFEVTMERNMSITSLAIFCNP